MAVLTRKHRIINALVLFLMLSTSPLLAQNLLYNGEFETNGGYTSEYERIYGANGVGAGCYAIDNTTANHGGGQGWPQPSNSSGRFMIVNGFGSNTNPTKIVWTTDSPIAVTPNTNYTFSCRVVNLNLAVNGQIYPAKLQLKINGVAAGSENQLPTHNNWQDWTVTWNSQNSTQAIIAIYDLFTGNSSFGDDYALDAMSFVANEVYSVTANDDSGISVCQGVSVDIDVLNNDVILPNANDAVVEVVTGPSHGTYTVLSNNKIRYTFTGGDDDTDQIKYRVVTHGVSEEAWVFIQTNRPPTVGSITTPPMICAGDNFTLVMPAIENNGATITDQGWQIQLDGNWQTLNNYNIPFDYNGCNVRYFVENECGMSYGDSIQVTVNDEPLVEDIVAPEGICEGESFDLTTPQVIWRHANPGTGSWEIQIDGEWQDLNNSDIPFSYNGCNIRYKAVNDCGTAYSSNNVQVTVYSTASIDEGEITACDAIYHHGFLCNQNGEYVADSVTPNGCSIQVSWHFTLGEAYVAPIQYHEACDSYYWPKTRRTYYESNVYDTLIVSGNPQICDSTYILDLTINHAPNILNDVEAPSSVCAGSPLYLNEPQYQMNHSGGGSQRWEYATSASGPFTAFDPLSSHLSYGTYFLRYVVTNTCGEVNSNVVSFHVNDAPVANVQLSSMQVCEGQTLDLPEVTVTWNNEDESDRQAQWQMASASDGTFTSISPTMPMQMNHNGNWLRFVAHNSCGEDIIGPVMIRVAGETEDWLETIHSCDSYTLETGEVITESQVIDYENYDPCYHLVHQPIEISYSDHVTEYITSCQEDFVWHGMTFHHSDQTQYSMVTLSNEAQCDSIVELQLDFGDYTIYTHDRTACGSYVWEMRPDHVYTESAKDSVFVSAVNEEDCDTWYYLNLTLGNDVMVNGEDMTECSGFVWHGIPYYADAILYDSLLTSGTRCDSVVAYQLHVIAPVATDTSIVSCKPILWQEHLCEEEGDYQHTFQSVYGCDSVVTMHFSLSEQLFHEFDTMVCNPFQWYEYQCNTDGMTCSHLFQTLQGCDSTVVMHVAMNEAVVTTHEIQACDHYEYNGVIYDEPGVIYFNMDTLETHAGCDSIVQIRLEIKNSDAIGEIHGIPSVYVASNLVSGMYRYEIDTADIVGEITWSLTNPQWQLLDAVGNYCRILVTTPGSTILKASFITAECGEMERTFEIHADYFGVEEQEEQGVQVYPNPTKGTITVEAEGIESIRLIDMLGQTLEAIDCGHTDSVTLNINNHTPLVYLLEIKANNCLVKKRVVLCR